MADQDSYNDSHRAFLQAFLACGSLTYEACKPILAAIFSALEGREILPNDLAEHDLGTYVNAVNEAISPLDLNIRSTFHQGTRQRVYALVNTTSDPLTQMATTHSAEEIAFVKRVLDFMFDGPANTRRTEAMCISGTEAVNLAKGSAGRRETQNGTSQQSGSQGLSMRDAEAMMGKLVDEGWMEKSRKGFFSLSARALMELRAWLVETYNDPEDGEEEDGRWDRIKACQACREIITVGQRCTQRECPCRLHDICTANFFRMQRNRACPTCKTEWDGNHFVGEKAITTSERYLKSRRRSGLGGKRPTQQAAEEVMEEEQGEEADG